MPRLKVYFADFHGIWLGGSAVVVAESEAQAAEMVAAEAAAQGVRDPGTITLKEIDVKRPGVQDLYNGDY